MAEIQSRLGNEGATVPHRRRGAPRQRTSIAATGERRMDNNELLAALRGDIAGINQRIDDTKSDLIARIDDTKSDLIARIDATNQRIDTTNEHISQTRTDLGLRIDDTKSALDARIDDTRTDLGARIDDTNRRIDAVGQIKLQGTGLVVAAAAATAVVGTFVLQVLAAL